MLPSKKIILGILSFLSLSQYTNASSPPHCPGHGGLVDLGYAKHIPTFVNTTRSGRRVSIYKNIRFGNSPTGDRRFQKPDTHLPKTDHVQDGVVPWGSTDCISSCPSVAPFPGISGSTWGHEDCLFLDVYVPEGVKPGDKVPVLHWFYGSAFAFGSKDILFNPMGLWDLDVEENNFIFVTNNYRMGIPGWMSAPGLDMIPNAGMYDCLAATEWTQKFADRFGGDPDRVTAMGQSAGAGIINLLTVLDGGKGRLPFQQAFISSPAGAPRKNVGERQKRAFEAIIKAANCSSLDCLRTAPEETILAVNDLFINQMGTDAGGGVFGPTPGFGPIADGHAIPDLPEVLLRNGHFHKELRALIVGNMAFEGMGTSHDTGLPEYFPIMARQIFPTASNETIQTIQSQYDYAENPAKLAWDWTTDVIFGCNAYNLARAYSGKTYRYIMSTPPAVHGQDLYSYFHVDQETTPTPDAYARDFQHRLLKFIHGKDMGWPLYGTNEVVFNITEAGFEKTPLARDLKARCELINKLASDPSNGA